MRTKKLPRSVVIGSLACFAVIAPAPTSLHGQAAARLAITGGTLIDGTGAVPIRQAVVLIQGDRIMAAGPATSVTIPRGTRVVDARGTWLVPGLVDVHVHFFESGRSYMRPAQIDLTALVPYEEEVAWTKGRARVTLRNYLCAGVTTVASMGGPRFEREARDIARSATAPNVFIAHGPVAVPASPGLAKAFPLFDGDNPVRVSSTAREARAEVEQAIASQADLLKTGYLGGGITPPRETELFWSEVLPALVLASREHKLPVVAHVETLSDAKRFVTAGVSRLAHTFGDAPADAEFLQLAKTHQAIVATTLAALARIVDMTARPLRLDPIETRCGDPEVIDSWSKLPSAGPPAKVIERMQAALRMMQQNVKALYDAGIPLAVGSDAAASPGLLHGASFHHELKLIADAGIPPAAVIVAATRSGARFIGKDADLGTIEAGKLADLLVLAADPMLAPQNLAAIRLVVKSGNVLDPRTLER